MRYTTAEVSASALDLAPRATPRHRFMSDPFLLAGRFGAATQLTPKALRLYAQQGLLVPAYVDPTTGYRYYAAEQTADARLIAKLRRLGLPVARVAQLLDMPAELRAAELRGWLASEKERLAYQTELVEVLARQKQGSDPALTNAITTRTLPATKIIYRQRIVDAMALDGFMADAGADIRAHLTANGLPVSGRISVTFHDLVTHDSEGLVEVAMAYDGSVEPEGDLRLRLQPERQEVFLPVPAAYENLPLVLHVYDALEAWLDARSDLVCADSPCETYPGTGGARFDVAYPVAA